MSINGYYRMFRNRVVISKKGREYKKLIQKACRDYGMKIKGKVQVSISFQLKTKREIDLDNLQKPLLDAIKDILIDDDKFIYKINSRKAIGCDTDSITLKIKNI